MITQKRLQELLYYNPNNGDFIRLKTSYNKPQQIGTIAGDKIPGQYVRISIDGERYYAHRLAWLWMAGEWPKEEIDHVNGIRNDNRWNNLRSASRKKNAQNHTKPRSDNKSGYLGVSFDSKRNKWTARIKINSTYKYLGRFDIKEDARDAYIKAKRKYHEGCTI